MPPKILAYHQVGTPSTSKEDRGDSFDAIMEDGLITPAVTRVHRGEMWEECYGDSYTTRILDQYKHASPNAKKALERLVGGWLAKLPEDGSRSTNFNCRDMVAGDFNRIFLSFTDFYDLGAGGKNGFVFDAEDLIRRGAHFRPRDLLRVIDDAIDKAVRYPYDSVEEAATAIERRISFEVGEHEFSGDEAEEAIRDCVSAKGIFDGDSKGCISGELVWQGALSISLAKEAWRVGKKVRL